MQVLVLAGAVGAVDSPWEVLVRYRLVVLIFGGLFVLAGMFLSGCGTQTPAGYGEACWTGWSGCPSPCEYCGSSVWCCTCSCSSSGVGNDGFCVTGDESDLELYEDYCNDSCYESCG